MGALFGKIASNKDFEREISAPMTLVQLLDLITHHMKLLPLALFVLLLSCDTGSENRISASRRLQNLDSSTWEATEINNRLDSILRTTNVEFKSIRGITDSAVNVLTEIARELITVTGGIIENSSDFMFPLDEDRVEHYLFADNDYRPYAAKRVIEIIQNLDRDPRTKGSIMQTFERDLSYSKAVKAKDPLDVKLFKNLNLSESVLLLNMISRQILTSEYRYLVNKLRDNETRANKM